MKRKRRRRDDLYTIAMKSQPAYCVGRDSNLEDSSIELSLDSSTRELGAAAEIAATRKTAKYSNLSTFHV